MSGAGRTSRRRDPGTWAPRNVLQVAAVGPGQLVQVFQTLLRLCQGAVVDEGAPRGHIVLHQCRRLPVQVFQSLRPLLIHLGSKREEAFHGEVTAGYHGSFPGLH